MFNWSSTQKCNGLDKNSSFKLGLVDIFDIEVEVVLRDIQSSSQWIFTWTRTYRILADKYHWSMITLHILVKLIFHLFNIST